MLGQNQSTFLIRKTLIFFRYIFRSGRSKSYRSLILHFLRNTILFSIMTASIYIPTNALVHRAFLSPHLVNTSYFLFRTIILTGVRSYLIVVLTCLLLMIDDAEHLFIYLLIIFVFFRKHSCSLSIDLSVSLYAIIVFKFLFSWDQRDSIVDKALALHAADQVPLAFIGDLSTVPRVSHYNWV